MMQFTSTLPIYFTDNVNQDSFINKSLSTIPFSCQFPTIESFYTQRGGSMQESFHEFESYWEHEGNLLPKPRLFMYRGRLENMSSQGLGILFADNTQQTAAAFWTIGNALEKKVSTLMDDGDLINGLILDVVGSRILVELHTTIQSWISKELAQPNGWNIIGEHYPEESQAEYLQSLLTLTGSDKEILLTDGTAMLTPQKTQYSFFMLGEGAPAELNKTVICSVCAGRRCPYWQLGGCHIT